MPVMDGYEATQVVRKLQAKLDYNHRNMVVFLCLIFDFIVQIYSHKPASKIINVGFRRYNVKVCRIKLILLQVNRK